MTAKEYLNQVFELDKAIRAKHSRINVLKDRAGQATSTVNALRTSGTSVHSVLEDSVCLYVDLQTEIAGSIKQFYNLQKEVAGTIEQVENSDYRALLEYRYLSFYSWEEVAVKMGYSWRWTMRLHSRALQAIESHIKSMI